MQTTADGQIWVGYFDEGVFGGGIGRAGAVCFDAAGKPVFRYNEFAIAQNLPPVADCYTLNVAEDAVWLCYYTAFPLVCLRDMQFDRVWPDFGATKAVAVRGKTFIRFPAYNDPYLRARGSVSEEEILLQLIAPDGRNLSQLSRSSHSDYESVQFAVCARGARMYVFDERGLYELP
jgi:hypothetical protein